MADFVETYCKALRAQDNGRLDTDLRYLGAYFGRTPEQVLQAAARFYFERELPGYLPTELICLWASIAQYTAPQDSVGWLYGLGTDPRPYITGQKRWST